MRPQIRCLLTQPQIRFPYTLCTHPFTLQLLLSCDRGHILDTSVRDRVDDLNALWAELAGQCLSKLPHGGATRTIRCELSIASQCTQCAREDKSTLLASTFAQWRGSVISLESF